MAQGEPSDATLRAKINNDGLKLLLRTSSENIHVNTLAAWTAASASLRRKWIKWPNLDDVTPEIIKGIKGEEAFARGLHAVIPCSP
jgi:hypothetical protein